MGNKKRFDPSTLSEVEREALTKLQEGAELTGKDGALTPMIKRILEAALDAELDQHIEGADPIRPNRRNGHMGKQMKSESGVFELLTPRDRDGSFAPRIVPKRQTVLGNLVDTKILALYSKGMSYRDIRDYVEEMYGFNLSLGMLSRITDRLLEEIFEWQSRPLESVYAIVWMDALHYKVRIEGRIETRAIYTVLGIDLQGQMDLLGIYSNESEGARFWLQVLTDLCERGVQDILIASIDNLTGFKEAIETVFPLTDVQLCIVHQIRNSIKYIPYKDQKPFIADLKKVYRATNKKSAEQYLNELENQWGKKYPVVIKSWRNNWEQLSNFFKYPPEIRRLIYTTNIIEGFHRQVRKVTKSKGAFTSENALLKQVYVVAQQVIAKWDTPCFGWISKLNQLLIIFGDRIKIDTV
jgi:putative transposase